MKHLNLTSSAEVRDVHVDLACNRFEAHVRLTSGSHIIFATAASLEAILANDELRKYVDQWNKPLRVSKSARYR